MAGKGEVMFKEIEFSEQGEQLGTIIEMLAEGFSTRRTAPAELGA